MAIDKIVAEYRIELEGLKNDVAQIKGQLKGVDDKVKESADGAGKKFDELGNQVSGKLSSAFTKLGGVIAAAFAVEKIGEFISSSIELAARAEGIRTAFNRLNDPTLLSRLREATKGTVSDLQLMQTAVKAANFKLPLDQLAKYLKFAQQRAIETGESIDYLVESIVLGISRKSIPILDNLGLSAQMIQTEFQKTGDFAKAVGNIIDESLGSAGETILTTAERQAQLRAEIENTKVEIGNGLLPAVNLLVDTTNKWVKGMSLIPDYFKLLFDFDGDFARLIQNNKKAKEEFEKYTEAVKQYTTDSDIIAFTKSYTDRLHNQSEEIRQNTQFASASAKVMGEEQVAAIKKLIDFIDDYSKTLLKKDKGDNKNIETTKKQTDAVWGLGKALLGWVSLVETTKPMETFGIDVNKTADALQNAKTELDKLIKLTPALSATTTTTTEKAKAEWEDYAHTLLSLFDSFNTAYTNSANYRLSVLENELESGAISQEKYDRQKRDILRREANREKAFSLLSISLSTARAIMAALGSVPPNPTLAALAGVTGAVQLGVAASQPIPQFKDGVIDLKGKGTETSDSNLALLSKGESVMTAKETRKYKPVLEAIRKDRFEDYIMKVYLKQIQGKNKEANSTLDEWLYRSYLAQQKLISATEKQGDKVSRAVREIPKRHRWQA